jgi:hypothetical protein
MARERDDEREAASMISPISQRLWQLREIRGYFETKRIMRVEKLEIARCGVRNGYANKVVGKQ